MENQHRKIKGYRELSENDISRMNRLKEQEQVILGELEIALGAKADPRWIAIAKTDLQKGFMAAIRAIAKPGGF